MFTVKIFKIFSMFENIINVEKKSSYDVKKQ